MGDVVPFHRGGVHVRTSAGLGAGLLCNTAKVCTVRPPRHLPSANPAKSSHRSAGIDPRARQELTVDGFSPSASATPLVPPSASMTLSTESNIAALIVRKMRTRQEFATRETISIFEYAAIGGMSDTVKIIAKRLVSTRLAIGVKQAEFCRQIGVEKNVYNPFEKGTRRITLEVALKIRARFGVSLDWIYCGDISKLSVDLYHKLARAA